MAKSNQPEPSQQYRQMAVKDLLTKDQMARVEEIFTQAVKTRASEQQIVRALKEYLNTIESELLDKGVLPDYLAYVLLANAKGII
jgi:hypothetical protein